MQSLALIVLLPLIVGSVACFATGAGGGQLSRRATAWVAGAVAAASVALLMAGAPAVLRGEVLLQSHPWLPELGLTAAFRLDGLSLLFAGLIGIIGLLIVLYAAYYLGPQDSARKFYTLLMFFMGAMLGVVLADNLLLLLVFWELTSVSSFLLVAFWGHRAEARAGARMALAVTGGGGLVMMAGVLLLGQIAGSYELGVLFERAEQVRADPRFDLAMVLVLVGCFTKSAQIPFHFWLPDAMAAPTPVSAYLHSATMVKAGIFLLARLYPVFGGSALFETIVTTVGLATLVFAAYVAVYRHDLKSMLAYSTISHLGLVTFLIGLHSPLSAVAAVFHVLNHATFKASLFMTAGIVDHETGTRDMRQLGGLARFMPWTATLAVVASASMAGVPLANGFLSKEMFFDEAVRAGAGAWGWLTPAAATLAGICSVAYSLRLVHDVFFGPVGQGWSNPQPHEPPFFMKAPVILLVLVCLVVGVFPAWTLGPLVAVAAAAVLGVPAPEHHLAIWHGFNLPLLMSMVALAGGVALYFLLRTRFDLHLHHPRGWTGRLFFTRVVDGLFAAARACVPRLESGSLQSYLAVMMGMGIVLAGWGLLADGPLPVAGSRELLPASPLSVALWLLLLAVGGRLVWMHHDRFQAVLLTGAVGLVATLSFVAFSAPDLALTQLSVDVVSTVLLLMGLALLPRRSPRESGSARRWRDALLSLVGGGGVAWLTWLVLTRDLASISWFFAEQAVPGAGGTNIVNVILVDFRGYDTFGEITVLGIAALGVMAVLDGLHVRRPAADEDGRPWSFAQLPLMLRVAGRLVLPVALVVSVYIFWRGHNLPGGGFIAGLVTAVALVLQYMAQGQARAAEVLRAAEGAPFVRWVGAGIGLAGLTGVASWLAGRPFLTSAHGHPTVPVLGELPLASAAVFDLGVYFTVVGATLIMLAQLGAVSRGASARLAQEDVR